MAFVSIKNVAFRGLACTVPKNIRSNMDVPEEKKSERERLVRNIGIQTRRLCPPGISFFDLSLNSAEKVIADLGWQKTEIEAIIVVTQTPDYLMPGNAVIAQHRLGLKTSTIAFDINLGCSGYPFGLYTLGSMLATGGIKKALLLVGDKSGSVNDPLFSDCGTATALEFDPSAPAMCFDLNTDGEGYRAIMFPMGFKSPITAERFEQKLQKDGSTRSDADLILDGPAVLSFSTTRVPPAINYVLESLKLKKDDIDFFYFHQANRMINATIAKKLGLADQKVPSTLVDFGNTSSASIPLTMVARTRRELMEANKRVLMCGFGIGLSWGTAVVELNKPVICELLEI